MLDRLESEILADRVSEESRRWLASCGLTVEQMPLTVILDAHGGDLYLSGPEAYRASR